MTGAELRRLRGRVGGHLGAATRMEGKAWAAARDGRPEAAAQLRKDAAEQRAIAAKLREQLHG